MRKIDFAIDFLSSMQNCQRKNPWIGTSKGFLAWSLTNSRSGLTLGELTGLSCFAEAVLLTLDDSGINSE